MSCLYSSPEVTCLGLPLSSIAIVIVRTIHARAFCAPGRSAVQFHTNLPYVAVSKDAFPTSPACVAGRIKSFRLPKQAQVSSVSFQAQYQAFVRFAVGSGAAN